MNFVNKNSYPTLSVGFGMLSEDLKNLENHLGNSDCSKLYSDVAFALLDGVRSGLQQICDIDSGIGRPASCNEESEKNVIGQINAVLMVLERQLSSAVLGYLYSREREVKTAEVHFCHKFLEFSKKDFFSLG